jgi:hypothetical protein
MPRAQHDVAAVNGRAGSTICACESVRVRAMNGVRSQCKVLNSCCNSCKKKKHEEARDDDGRGHASCMKHRTEQHRGCWLAVHDPHGSWRPERTATASTRMRALTLAADCCWLHLPTAPHCVLRTAHCALRTAHRARGARRQRQQAGSTYYARSTQRVGPTRKVYSTIYYNQLRSAQHSAGMAAISADFTGSTKIAPPQDSGALPSTHPPP